MNQTAYIVYKDLLSNRMFCKRNGGLDAVIKIAEKLIRDLERKN